MVRYCRRIRQAGRLFWLLSYFLELLLLIYDLLVFYQRAAREHLHSFSVVVANIVAAKSGYIASLSYLRQTISIVFLPSLPLLL